MEIFKSKSARAKGRSISNAESNGEVGVSPAQVAERWEDSLGRVGQENQKIKLAVQPRNVWEDYKTELEKAQAHLAKNHDPLRIAYATVSSLTAPDSHETGYGEIQITKGEGFSALLTDGTTIKAE